MNNTKENRAECREFMTVVVEVLESMDMPISNYLSSEQSVPFLIESFYNGLTVDETIDRVLSM